MDVGACRPPGCASTRPGAVFCNPFGVDGRWGLSFPRVREYATLGCVLQPLRGRWTLGLVVPQGARVRDPGLCSATPLGEIGRGACSFPRGGGHATLGCVLQPLRGNWTLGLFVPQGAG